MRSGEVRGHHGLVGAFSHHVCFYNFGQVAMFLHFLVMFFAKRKLVPHIVVARTATTALTKLARHCKRKRVPNCSQKHVAYGVKIDEAATKIELYGSRGRLGSSWRCQQPS